LLPPLANPKLAEFPATNLSIKIIHELAQIFVN
jgi:hypothetical protein